MNTMFEKPWEKTWTHTSAAGRQRVIDYFCVEKAKRGAVHDLEVWDMVNLGSDHRAIRMTMRVGSSSATGGRGGVRSDAGEKKKTKTTRGWRPREEKEYLAKLGEKLPEDEQVTGMLLQDGAEKLLRNIEGTLLGAAVDTAQKREAEVRMTVLK